MSIEDFKKSLSSINEIIYFDSNEYLREKPANRLKLQQMIVEAENLLKNCTEEDDKYFLCGTLGNLYRISGQPQIAIDYLTYCIRYATQAGNIKKEIVSLIRFGEALKYDGKHDRALEVFNGALDNCKDNNVITYLDFVLQHKGKCLLELGRLAEAEKYLLEALKLRKIKGDPALIESTKQAIDLVGGLKNK